MLLPAHVRRARRLAAGLTAVAVTLMLAAGGALAAAAHRAESTAGYTVYTELNGAQQNRIARYHLSPEGILSRAGVIASGGQGLGTIPDTPSALVLSGGRHFLLAVNMGDATLSSFAVNPDGGLRLISTVPSGGEAPNAVTVHGNLAYVLNTGNHVISGFRFGAHGVLRPLAGSARPTGGTIEAQVGFDPAGTVLVVTNRGNSIIRSYPVRGDGLLGPGHSVRSPINGPFGFAFSPTGVLIVSQANVTFNMRGAHTRYFSSAVVSYRLDAQAALHRVMLAPNHQTSSCWVATTPDGRFAYSSNFGPLAGDGTVSSYRLAPGGRVPLLQPAAATLTQRPAVHGEELAVTPDSRYLLVNRIDNNPGYSRHGGINVYRIAPDGGLTLTDTIAGLPGSVTGLAIR